MFDAAEDQAQREKRPEYGDASSPKAGREVIKKGVMVLQTGVVSGVPGSAYTSWGAVKQVYDDVFAEMIIGTGVYDKALIDAAQAKLEALKK